LTNLACRAALPYSLRSDDLIQRLIQISIAHVSAKDIIIQTEHLSPHAAEWLRERCTLIACAFDDPMFEAHLSGASGLVVRTYTQVNQTLLAKAPKLRVVGRAGVGLDNIDVSACRRRGVEVVYTPDANTQAVVEFVFAILLDTLRPRVTLSSAIPTAQWNELRERIVGERQLNELTFGILGLGRVGKRIAQAASALGCRVIFSDIQEIETAQRFGAEPVDARTLFRESDVLSVHIDGRANNRRFVNAEMVGLLKSSAILVNSSRGFVVDNSAIRGFLEKNSGEGALALLDVHEPEPFGSDYPLLGLPNVRLFPHLASRTHTAMENMSWVVRDVVAVLEGRRPEFPAPESETGG
jgi:phosphoglycerate dehydrogenase-like enzyme